MERGMGMEWFIILLIWLVAPFAELAAIIVWYEIYNTGKPEKDYYEMFVMEDKTNLKEAILPVTYLDGKRKHGRPDREAIRRPSGLRRTVKR